MTRSLYIELTFVDVTNFSQLNAVDAAKPVKCVILILLKIYGILKSTHVSYISVHSVYKLLFLGTN